MKKKILYLFSDTGGGHRATTNALISAVKEIRGDDIEQKMIDAFVESSKFMGIASKMYGPAISSRFGADVVWKALWYGTNNKPALKVLEAIGSPFMLQGMAKIFNEYMPDAIVSMHPLLNHLTARVLKNMERKIPFIIVTVDPVSLHKSWITNDADVIVVSTDEAAETCIKEKIPEDKIKVLGFPVRPGFLEGSDKNDARAGFGLKKDLFTVLVMGGGEGAGNISDIVNELNRSEMDMQLIVICGRNEKLKEKLDAVQYRSPVKIFGFTEEVPKIMTASDIIVTKGGPGAVFEAIAKELPLVITNWLPGQEEGNVRYVKAHGIGVVERNPKDVSGMIKRILEKDLYSKMKEKIKAIRKPRSVFDIAELIISYAGS